MTPAEEGAHPGLNPKAPDDDPERHEGAEHERARYEWAEHEVTEASAHKPSSWKRTDSMTGANWKSVSFGANVTSHSIAVDPTGMVLVGGGGARIVDNMTGVLTSSGSAGALSYANQNIGTSSSSQAITVRNIGGSALNFSGISASGPFVETDNCQPSLQAGASCTVNVSFAPTIAGAASSTLIVTETSGAQETPSVTGTVGG